MLTSNNELIHYGRLGMKWGQHIYGRKSTGSNGNRGGLPSRIKEKLSSRKRKQQTQELLKKSNNKPATKTMSDDELRTRINRMQLEKQYKQLHAELNPTPKSKKQQVIDIVSKSGQRATEDLLTQAFKSAGSAAANKAIRKIITQSNERQPADKRMSDDSIEQFLKEVKIYSNNQKK